jgi:hypothetical protein
VAPSGLIRLLGELRASQFAALAGARVSASVPIPEALLNELVTAAIPAGGPVRDLSLHPKAGNRIAVRAKLARADFLPPVTLTAEIERQPDLPDGPLVLRILSLPGLMALAGAAMSMASVLPQGVRMENQRLLVDLPVLLERRGYGEVLPFLESIHVKTEEGRVLVDVTARVR